MQHSHDKRYVRISILMAMPTQSNGGLVLIDVLFCDLGVIWFRIIWCDFIEVWLGLSWFVFDVVWCLLMWFGVICTFFVLIDVLWCDLGVIWF